MFALFDDLYKVFHIPSYYSLTIWFSEAKILSLKFDNDIINAFEMVGL
jgi:hypothetical protein